MGILADIFISRPEDAAQYEQASLAHKHAPDPRFTSVHYKRLMSLEFAMLWAILADEPYEYEKHHFSHIAHTDATTLDQFPPAALSLLAAMTPETMASVAETWSAIEELQWAPADVAPVLADLQRLARLAEAEGKSMYIWNSL